MSQYQFQAQPRPVQTRTTKPKYRQNEEKQNESFTNNIMFDSRVVRGSTYAPARRTSPLTPGFKNTTRPSNKSPVRANIVTPSAHENYLRISTPEPVENRMHCAVQTDTYLEDLRTKKKGEKGEKEKDFATQTEAELDFPTAPLFTPVSSGYDVSTQLNKHELFDFDLNVTPILNVLVEKSLEQALMEVCEEEEIKEIEENHRRYLHEKNLQLSEVQRLVQKEERKQAELQRRLQQEKERVQREKELAEKHAAQTAAKELLAQVSDDVLSNMHTQGHFYDPVRKEVEEIFLPFLLQQTAQHLQQYRLARDLIDSTLQEARDQQRQLIEYKKRQRENQQIVALARHKFRKDILPQPAILSVVEKWAEEEENFSRAIQAPHFAHEYVPDVPVQMTHKATSAISSSSSASTSLSSSSSTSSITSVNQAVPGTASQPDALSTSKSSSDISSSSSTSTKAATAAPHAHPTINPRSSLISAPPSAALSSSGLSTAERLALITLDVEAALKKFDDIVRIQSLFRAREGRKRFNRLKAQKELEERRKEMSPAELLQSLQPYLGIDVTAKAGEDTEGVLITSLDTLGPGAQGTLCLGDTIVKVGDVRIRKLADYQQIVSKLPTGTSVKLTVCRKEKPDAEEVVAIEVSTHEKGYDHELIRSLRGESGHSVPSSTWHTAESALELLQSYPGKLGCSIAESTSKHAKGVKVSKVTAGSAADLAFIREGDYILSINDQDITDNKSLLNALKNKVAGDVIRIRLVRLTSHAEKTPRELSANEAFSPRMVPPQTPQSQGISLPTPDASSSSSGSASSSRRSSTTPLDTSRAEVIEVELGGGIAADKKKKIEGDNVYTIRALRRMAGLMVNGE